MRLPCFYPLHDRRPSLLEDAVPAIRTPYPQLKFRRLDCCATLQTAVEYCRLLFRLGHFFTSKIEKFGCKFNLYCPYKNADEIFKLGVFGIPKKFFKDKPELTLSA
jgi:hypothetical protein